MTHELVRRYGDPARLVTDAPQSATDLYRLWAGVGRKSLNRRERNERRWLALALENPTRQGVIRRGVITADRDRTYIAFWREVDPSDAAHAGPGVPGQDAPVRPERRVG